MNKPLPDPPVMHLNAPTPRPRSPYQGHRPGAGPGRSLTSIGDGRVPFFASGRVAEGPSQADGEPDGVSRHHQPEQPSEAPFSEPGVQPSAD